MWRTVWTIKPEFEQFKFPPRFVVQEKKSSPQNGQHPAKIHENLIFPGSFWSGHTAQRGANETVEPEEPIYRRKCLLEEPAVSFQKVRAFVGQT